jgi:undecaprenyl-diphosphatase
MPEGPPPNTEAEAPPREVPLAAALIVLGLIVLAFTQLGHSRWVEVPGGLDVAIHARVVRLRPEMPWLTTLFRAVTRFGNPDFAVTATVLVTLALYAMHRRGLGGIGRWEAIFWLGGIVGGRFLSNGLKLVYRRERPPPADRLVTEAAYSFPSTHSVFAAAFFTMLAILLVRAIPRRRRWLRLLAAVACLGMAVAVAASRVWLGVHYPTDVAGGLLLGAGWVFTVSLARAVWARRRGGASA